LNKYTYTNKKKRNTLIMKHVALGVNSTLLVFFYYLTNFTHSS